MKEINSNQFKPIEIDRKLGINQVIKRKESPNKGGGARYESRSVAVSDSEGQSHNQT